MCVIHEVEVDTIKKDNLSLYHYSVFIAVLFWNNCEKYDADEFVYNHLFKLILFCNYFFKIR